MSQKKGVAIQTNIIAPAYSPRNWVDFIIYLSYVDLNIM